MADQVAFTLSLGYYTRGAHYSSENGGASWTLRPPYDMKFKAAGEENLNGGYYGVISNLSSRKAQTFSPVVGQAITELSLWLGKNGTPPATLYVAIKAVDGSSHPTGGILSSGQTDTASLPPSNMGTNHEERVIDLAPGYGLITDVEYALIFGLEPISDSATVTTNPATDIETSYATLNGLLDDDGNDACDCVFEWGETAAYGDTTSIQSKTTGETFSQLITGLSPNTLYHFRAKATNPITGASYGIDQTFTTKAAITAGLTQAHSIS